MQSSSVRCPSSITVAAAQVAHGDGARSAPREMRGGSRHPRPFVRALSRGYFGSGLSVR